VLSGVKVSVSEAISSSDCHSVRNARGAGGVMRVRKLNNLVERAINIIMMV
jgi:hypothetical protein